MPAFNQGTAAVRLAVQYRGYYKGINLQVVRARVVAALGASPISGHVRVACELQPNPSVQVYWIDRFLVRNQWHVLLVAFLEVDQSIDTSVVQAALQRALVASGVPRDHTVAEFSMGHMTASEAQQSPPPAELAPRAPSGYAFFARTSGPGESGFVPPGNCPGGQQESAPSPSIAYGPVAAPSPPSTNRMPTGVSGAVLTGTQFTQSLQGLSENARDEAIYNAAMRGNFPSFVRELATINVHITSHTGSYKIMPDYMAIGTDEDYLYVPLKPRTAQRLANAWGMLLPTPKIVADVFANAATKLVPHPLSPVAGEGRPSTRLYVESSRLVKEAKGSARGLVTGGKKNVVISTALTSHPGKVLIFGWYYPTLAQAKIGMGNTQTTLYIQPHSWVHDDTYVDYSHGIQFVDGRMVVDGVERNTEDVLKDRTLFRLLSGEDSAMRSVRYPT